MLHLVWAQLQDTRIEHQEKADSSAFRRNRYTPGSTSLASFLSILLIDVLVCNLPTKQVDCKASQVPTMAA